MTCCMDCEKRHVGCHSDCEEYLNEKEQHKADMEARKMKKTVSRYNYDSKHSAKWRKHE